MKLNVDASIKLGTQTFSARFILRDHCGSFVVGKTSRFQIVSTVFEAEALALREGIHWFLSMTYLEVNMLPLMCASNQNFKENHLKVGHILDDCGISILSGSGFLVAFVKR